MKINEIVTLLKVKNFKFNHSLGQNFLVDEAVLQEIISKAECEGKNVLEIGAGAGCLTVFLAKAAKKVVAIEIDKTLIDVLDTTLATFQNTTVIAGDVLKIDLEKLCKEQFNGEEFMIVSNLPYYITTPIISSFFKFKLNVTKICIMLQKEAASRILAKEGTKDYSPLSVLCNYKADVKTIIQVPPHCFLPQPKVSSVIIELKLRPYAKQVEEESFNKLLKGCFAMRRKTLLNNLITYGIEKKVAVEVIEKLGLQIAVRAEMLSLDEFIDLHKLLTNS